ncbi:UNVERIFIED_CONTAM: hypothetical protein K2H54_063153, partial [Gekko kuhli]
MGVGTSGDMPECKAASSLLSPALFYSLPPLDESSLKMNEVGHVPQSRASYAGSYLWGAQRDEHGADMLKPDPRDTFFLTPQIEPSHVENVLVPCAYSPTYVVKDFPIARYQGLQFVYLSFVYPNDFTRLTHMETENKCFYRESPLYLEKFGFYKYMKMDEEEEDLRQRAFLFLNPEKFFSIWICTALETSCALPMVVFSDFLEEEEEGADSPEPTDSLPDTKDRSPPHTLDPRVFPEPQRQERARATKEYGRDMDYYAFHQKQERLEEEGALAGQPGTPGTESGPSPSPVTSPEGFQAHDNAAALGEQEAIRRRSLSWAPNEENRQKAGEVGMLPQPKRGSSLSLHPHLSVSFFPGKPKQQSPKEEKQPMKENKKPPEKVYVTRLQPSKKKAPPQKETFPGVFLYPRPPRKMQLNSRSPQHRPAPANKFHSIPGRRIPWLTGNISRETDSSKRKKERASRKWEQLYDQEISRSKIKHNVQPSVLSMPAEGLFSKENFDISTPARVTLDYNSSEMVLSEGVRVTSFLRMSEMTESQQDEAEGPEKAQEEEEEELSDYSYENSELQQGWLEDSINWQRTFSVSPVDFELLRSDWNDLRCNVSGNLQLSESEVVDVVAQYMEKLNEKNGGIYTLLRIINVEKRRDTARGNRYLVELELMERGQRTVRLSEYIYVLLHQGKSEDSTEVNPEGPATVSTESQPPPSAWSLLYGKPILCRPQQLNWRRDVMVHFVVP